MMRFNILRVVLIGFTAACVVIGIMWRSLPQFGTGLDTRNESHHRSAAGLFAPECEPLLVQMTSAQGARVRGAYLRVQSEIGRLFIWKNSFHEIPVYLLDGAFDAHVEVAVPRDFRPALVYMQNPRHPFGEPSRQTDGVGRDQGDSKQVAKIRLPSRVEAVFPEPGVHLRVAVVAERGSPVPFALIRFEREGFGTIAVQCDADGYIGLCADSEFVLSAAVVSAVAVELGALLGRRPLASHMRAIEGAILRIEYGD